MLQREILVKLFDLHDKKSEVPISSLIVLTFTQKHSKKKWDKLKNNCQPRDVAFTILARMKIKWLEPK